MNPISKTLKNKNIKINGNGKNEFTEINSRTID